MASLRWVKGYAYARVRIWNSKNGVDRFISVSLRTKLESIAKKRLIEINDKESIIKNGDCVSFWWLNDEGKTKILNLTVLDAIKNFIAYKNVQGLRQSSLERYNVALSHFMTVVGRSTPIKYVNENSIDKFKTCFETTHSPNTINCNLAKIKAFLRWSKKKGHIDRYVEVDMVNADSRPVRYLSDSNFIKIMKMDWLDNHFKRVFIFYFETGCRLSEPFLGVLSDNWLIIEPENAKTHEIREIELSPLLLTIYNEMMKRFELRRKRGSKKKVIWDLYSKKFKKVLRKIGLDNYIFHNLRDTYAVRRWALTGDIKLVSKQLGHKSISMTEKYAQFNLRRLKKDFPTLQKYIEPRLKEMRKADYFLGLSNAGKTLKLGNCANLIVPTIN